MDFPVIAVNGGATPYTGTIISGLPLPRGLRDPIDVIMVDAESGETHRAAHHILTRHEDGTAKWLLCGVEGTFDPGETKLYAVPNYAGLYDGGVRQEFFVPENYLPATKGGAYVKYVDFQTKEEGAFLLDFSTLSQHHYQPHYGNEVMMMFEWWGQIKGDLWWRLFAEVRKGERGVRFEFQLESHGKGYDDGGKPPIIKEASVWHSQAAPGGTPPVFAWGDQFKPGDSWYGELGIAHGKECCPLEMGYSTAHGVVYAKWITSETRIPQGGNYTPWAAPGEARNPGNAQQWPESDLGDFVYEKRSVRFFIGDPMPQEHLDNPPMMVWEDCERYDEFLVGGISPVEPWKDENGVPLDQRTLQRFERRAAAAWDPDACTPGEAGGPGERITLTRFRERGGTYPRTPDKNPMYGSLSFGDKSWGSGMSGGAHYDIDHAFMYQFLRSRDFRVWNEAYIASKHFRTVDFQWAADPGGDVTQNPKEGLSTYEKGYQHGNYSLGTITHTWVGGSALAYCLTGHPEYLRLMKQVAHHLVTREHMDGGAVPSHWAVGTANDPRDWGANGSRRYGQNGGGSAAWGWQGDWGIRRAGRVLEVATALKVYLNQEINYDLDAFYMRALSNIERVETGIWGGNGYILNRASRGSRYDAEQGWMHSYVVRGVGYALIYGAPEVAQGYRALYDRLYDWLLNITVYGHKDPATGHYVSPRLAARYDSSGVIAITRFGITSPTVQAWYKWRDSVTSGSPNETFFTNWTTLFDADHAAMQSYVSPAGHTAWLLDAPEFQQYVAIRNRIAYDVSPTHGDFVYLKARQWSFTIDADYAKMNHNAIGADALAQGALELNRADGEMMAIRLSEAAQWHLYGNNNHGPLARIDQNASPISWRMSMYPNSETKINGNQLEDRYARRILGQLDKVAAFWDETVTDVPDEINVNPWVGAEAVEIDSPTDVNGRVDMISSDPAIPGRVPVITTAVLDGKAMPVFVEDEVPTA